MVSNTYIPTSLKSYAYLQNNSTSDDLSVGLHVTPLFVTGCLLPGKVKFCCPFSFIFRINNSEKEQPVQLGNFLYMYIPSLNSPILQIKILVC